MASGPEPLDYWRKLFRSANCDIFEVIEHAILVAAADCPKEFRSRRGVIAEKLLACRLSRSSGCNRVELRVAEQDDEAEANVDGSVKRASEKGSSNGVPEDCNRARERNYSYNEVKALTEEMEEETQIVGEVMRIKEVLCSHEDKSDSVLFDSLRRLQQTKISVETLKATEIGRTVNGLRKHTSKPVRNIARTLIQNWKLVVFERITSTAAIADHTPQSTNPSVPDDEVGLPSPPMDEGALLATASIPLSEVFDEVDDEGNVRTSAEFNKSRDTPKLLSHGKKASPLHPKPQQVHRPSTEQKPSSQMIKPSTNLEEKLELSKRKLHERYQQAENAKRQRTIQVVELCDLPRQPPARRQTGVKLARR